MGGVVAENEGCECMGGTRGLGVVSSAYDVQEMSVRGVRGVYGVCEMYMARGGRCGGSGCEDFV